MKVRKKLKKKTIILNNIDVAEIEIPKLINKESELSDDESEIPEKKIKKRVYKKRQPKKV